VKNHISDLHQLGVVPLPANSDPLRNADAHARIKEPCSDTMEIGLNTDGQRIPQVAYITDGNHASHACGATTAWLAEGENLNEVLQFTPEEVLKTLVTQITCDI
jgi:NifU-like protein involved in Fe-S cluster formation